MSRNRKPIKKRRKARRTVWTRFWKRRRSDARRPLAKLDARAFALMLEPALGFSIALRLDPDSEWNEVVVALTALIGIPWLFLLYRRLFRELRERIKRMPPVESSLRPRAGGAMSAGEPQVSAGAIATIFLCIAFGIFLYSWVIGANCGGAIQEVCELHREHGGAAVSAHGIALSLLFPLRADHPLSAVTMYVVSFLFVVVLPGFLHVAVT